MDGQKGRRGGGGDKRGGQMDRLPGGQAGDQEVDYRMVGWVGLILCPPYAPQRASNTVGQ